MSPLRPGIDFFTIPSATFRVLYGFVVLDHGRRRIRHVNVTEHPTAEWTRRQLLDACHYEDRTCEPSCRAATTRMRRSRWWMRYSNRHPPSVSSALAECASLQNALVPEMLSILAAISSKTSNARKSKSAGASMSAAK